MFNWTNVMAYQEHLKDLQREAAHLQLVAQARPRPHRKGNGIGAWVLYALLLGFHSLGKMLNA